MRRTEGESEGKNNANRHFLVEVLVFLHRLIGVKFRDLEDKVEDLLHSFLQ